MIMQDNAIQLDSQSQSRNWFILDCMVLEFAQMADTVCNKYVSNTK